MDLYTLVTSGSITAIIMYFLGIYDDFVDRVDFLDQKDLSLEE